MHEPLPHAGGARGICQAQLPVLRGHVAQEASDAEFVVGWQDALGNQEGPDEMICAGISRGVRGSGVLRGQSVARAALCACL